MNFVRFVLPQFVFFLYSISVLTNLNHDSTIQKVGHHDPPRHISCHLTIVRTLFELWLNLAHRNLRNPIGTLVQHIQTLDRLQVLVQQIGPRLQHPNQVNHDAACQTHAHAFDWHVIGCVGGRARAERTAKEDTFDAEGYPDENEGNCESTWGLYVWHAHQTSHICPLSLLILVALQFPGKCRPRIQSYERLWVSICDNLIVQIAHLIRHAIQDAILVLHLIYRHGQICLCVSWILKVSVEIFGARIWFHLKHLKGLICGHRRLTGFHAGCWGQFKGGKRQIVCVFGVEPDKSTTVSDHLLRKVEACPERPTLGVLWIGQICGGWEKLDGSYRTIFLVCIGWGGGWAIVANCVFSRRVIAAGKVSLGAFSINFRSFGRNKAQIANIVVTLFRIIDCLNAAQFFHVNHWFFHLTHWGSIHAPIFIVIVTSIVNLHFSFPETGRPDPSTVAGRIWPTPQFLHQTGWACGTHNLITVHQKSRWHDFGNERCGPVFIVLGCRTEIEFGRNVSRFARENTARDQ